MSDDAPCSNGSAREGAQGAPGSRVAPAPLDQADALYTGGNGDPQLVGEWVAYLRETHMTDVAIMEAFGVPDLAKLVRESGSLGLGALGDEDVLLRVLSLKSRAQVEPDSWTDALGSTEDELATAMAARALPTLRWSPGLGWMHYDGQQWRYDYMLEHFAVARQVAHDAAVLMPMLRQRLATAKTVSAIAQLARTDPRLRIEPSAWDADPLLLNTPAGVVDLRTARVRRRSELDYSTMCTAAPPGHIDQCPRWMQFMREVFVLPEGGPDLALIAHMQRAFGYWLSGSVREQVIWFLYGLGANGKSVFVATARWMLGDYGIRQPASVLMSRQQEAHPTEIADLRGKRLSVSSELEQNQHLAESKIKELTGEATQRARRMRQDSFEFPLTHKHVLAGNFRPRLNGGDPAMRRRVLLVPFLATFAGEAIDRDLIMKLRAEGPGILAWAIEGARQWYASGLAVPPSITENSVGYFDDFDDVAQWMAECCRRIDQEKATPLYRSYADWKRTRNETPASMTNWTERLASIAGISKTKSHGVMLYRGISLTADERDRQDPGSSWHRCEDHRG